MKKSLKVVLILTLALVLVFSLAACAPGAATLEKLDQTAMTFSQLGETQILKAELSEGTLEEDIAWASENEAVVKVGGGSESVMVMAVGSGKTNVTAKLGETTLTCEVTVADVEVAVSTDKEVVFLEKGKDATIGVEVTTANVFQDTGVTFVSSDTAVATVDSTGKVTAKGAGAALITITTNEGTAVNGGPMGTVFMQGEATVPVIVGQETALVEKLAGKYSDEGIYWVGSSDNALATKDSKTGKYTLAEGYSDDKVGYVKSWVELTIQEDGSFTCVANGMMRAAYHAILNEELATPQSGVDAKAVVGYFTAQPWNRATQEAGNIPANAVIHDEKGAVAEAIDGMGLAVMSGTMMGFKDAGYVAVVEAAEGGYDIMLVGCGSAGVITVGHFTNEADLNGAVNTYLTYDEFGKTVGNGNFASSVSATMNRQLTKKEALAA